MIEINTEGFRAGKPVPGLCGTVPLVRIESSGME